MSEAQGKWYVTHVYNEKDNSVNVEAKYELDGAKRDELIAANKEIAIFFSSLNVVKSVYANRNDVLEAIVAMAKAYLDGPQAAEAIMEHANFDLARRFANTCSLFRSFLDHFDKYYVHNFGKDSEKYKDWKDSLSKEYDDVASYRIVYMMRNFIQHYDMPPLKISISESKIEKGFKTKVSIDLIRLNEDKEIRKKIKLTEEGKTEISLFKTINEWSESFRRISDRAIKDRATGLLPYAESIISVRSSLSVSGGKMALIFLPHTDKKPDHLDLKMNYLVEAKAATLIELAAAGAPSVAPDPPEGAPD